jgi:TonB family protein
VNPTVILEVHIDPTGKVSNVELLRKSGSVAIDEPTRNAVYQWWFEPAHDKAGRPIPDVVCFTIEYR